MLILSSTELAAILIILQICPLYSLRIPHKHYKKPCTTALLLINTHLHYSTILMLTPTTNLSITELGESVIFQPVLQAYHTQHSWIITAHISLGNLECHWRTFNRQFDRTQQLLRSLDQHPSAPTQLLLTLQLELSNIKDIYSSGKTTITSAIKLLTNPTNCGHTSITEGAYYPSLEMPSVGLLGQPLQKKYTSLNPG